MCIWSFSFSYKINRIIKITGKINLYKPFGTMFFKFSLLTKRTSGVTIMFVFKEFIYGKSCTTFKTY